MCALYIIRVYNAEFEMDPTQQKDLGIRIQLLRKRCGLSIRQLAANAGVTAGMVSCIERGTSSPSIGLLRKVLEALGTDLGTFFGEGDGRQDGTGFLREGMKSVMDSERRYTLIFPRRQDVAVQMHDERYTAKTPKPPFEKLPCAVAGYVLEGKFVLEIEGEDQKTLRTGDAFYVPAGVAHRGYAEKGEDARLITVYTPVQY